MGYNCWIMLKRLAIVGLLLTAVPPMPGQAIKAAAQGGDKSQNQSQSKQAATAPGPMFVGNPVQPGSAKPDGQSIAGEDKEHSVKLTGLPPVTLTDKPKTFWDHVLDWGPWVFNFGLVVVGILQVVLLKRTWKTIERQANIMDTQARDARESSAEATRIALAAAKAAQKSADAAIAQIQMMIAKERAWIEITFAEDSDAMTIRPDEMVTLGRFHLNLKNVGGTAARNITGWYDTFASEEEKPQETEDKFFLAPPTTVEGNSWEPIPAPLTIDPRFTADRAPELFYVYLRGEITYNDIFKKEPNVTRFLLRRQFIRGEGEKAVSREFWAVIGDGENEST